MKISIKTMRELKGMSQRALAEELRIKQAAVAQWETGKTSPRLAILVKLAEILECTTDDLVRPDEPEEPE